MTRRAWEPPLFEWTQLGPVPVELAETLEHNGERLAGFAMVYQRRVVLDSALADQAMRVVYLHEMLHLWLHDAGVVLPEATEEVICTALASALVAREDFHIAGGVGPEQDP
jgi:hypothetical protein